MTCIFLAGPAGRADDRRVNNPASLPYGAHIRQAQSMVSVQARCSMNEALALMLELAEATDCTIDDIAGQVLERWIGFN